mmetsp:Transcript_22760/g.68335  ORF Transcript_22760/g.68335 Transcript_22760/m.68335 type:complete len:231 (-) Transcript_22760:22-714(-)
MLQAFVALTLLAAAHGLQPIVAVELETLWKNSDVRKTAGNEVNRWIEERLGGEVPNVYEEFDLLAAQGAEFGMMQPGVFAVARETLSIVATASGAFAREDAAAGEETEAKEAFEQEALACWLQAHDAACEQHLDPACLKTLTGLDAERYGITASLSDHARLPSLAAHLAGTTNTYDFTVPAADAWDVCLQVILAQYPGRKAYFVGTSEVGVASAEKLGMETVPTVGDLNL